MGQIVLLFITTVFMVIIGQCLFEKIRLKIFDSMSYQYCLIDFDNFTYQNIEFDYKQKHFKVNIDTVKMDDSVKDIFSTDVYCINDVPVLYLHKMKHTFTVSRRVDIEHGYNSYEVYKLLKLARKEFDRRFSEKRKLDNKSLLN